MELNIGSVIANVRRSKGLTQEALADAVGVSSAAVSKWETGASYPDITLLPPIARTLDLTVDALLDYHAQPSDEELRALTEQLGGVFDEQGYAAGQAACEKALHEYPSCAPLKLNIGSLYYRYISFALNGASDPDTVLEQMVRRSLSLFEQAERESATDSERQMARTLRISALIMVSRYDEAETVLDSLPKRQPLASPEQLYQTLYLARGELDKAERMNQRALFEQYSAAFTSLMNLAAVARRRGDGETAQRFTDACCGLNALFRLDPTGGLQMQLSLAGERGDTARALALFERYIDAVIARTFDYTENPFFATVQTRVITKNELNAMNRLVLRAAGEDGDFAHIRNEPRFAAALARLRQTLDGPNGPPRPQ